MKKTLSILLCVAMLLSTVTGCGPKGDASGTTSSGTGSDQSSGSASTSQPGDKEGAVRLALLSGPTGVGAAQLLSENEAGNTTNPYDVSVVASNDQVTTDLIGPNPSIDIAALATNVAANLAAKSNGAIQVLAVNTLGVLYILEKGDSVHTISDLAGKTVYATGQGANPEYVLNHLLTQNDVDPTKVDIQWMTPQEVSAKMASSESAICMLPVPAATALLVQDSGVRQAISLSDSWDKLDGGALAMGCVVARTDFIQENPQVVDDFLSEYHDSIEYVADPANRDSAAQLVAQYEITPNAKVAAAAIDQCNLTFLTGDEMRDTLEQYFQILFQANPASIGGVMPYDSFYYGAD